MKALVVASLVLALPSIGLAAGPLPVVAFVERDQNDRDPEPAATRDELARFQGTWQLIAAESTGEKTPAERIKAVRVTIAGNTHTVRFGEQIVAHDVSFAIDPSRSPKEVTDTINDGPNRGNQIRGIYNLEGDTLISCVAPVGKDRPTAFSAAPGSGWTLRVFRRAKADSTAQEAAIAAEQTRFDGSWRYTSVKSAGMPVRTEGLANDRLVLKGPAFTLTRAGVTSSGVYSVGPTGVPKAIDVAFTEGPQRGQIALGIYTLDGDTCTVCIAPGSKVRPEEFTSRPGSRQVLEVLKREQR